MYHHQVWCHIWSHASNGKISLIFQTQQKRFTECCIQMLASSVCKVTTGSCIITNVWCHIWSHASDRKIVLIFQTQQKRFTESCIQMLASSVCEVTIVHVSSPKFDAISDHMHMFSNVWCYILTHARVFSIKIFLVTMSVILAQW